MPSMKHASQRTFCRSSSGLKKARHRANNMTDSAHAVSRPWTVLFEPYIDDQLSLATGDTDDFGKQVIHDPAKQGIAILLHGRIHGKVRLLLRKSMAPRGKRSSSIRTMTSPLSNPFTSLFISRAPTALSSVSSLTISA